MREHFFLIIVDPFGVSCPIERDLQRTRGIFRKKQTRFHRLSVFVYLHVSVDITVKDLEVILYFIFGNHVVVFITDYYNLPNTANYFLAGSCNFL